MDSKVLRYTLIVFLPIAGLIVGAAVGIYLYQQANPVTTADVALNTNIVTNEEVSNVNLDAINSVLENGNDNANAAVQNANDLSVEWLQDPLGVDPASIGLKIVDSKKDLYDGTRLDNVYHVYHVGTVSGGIFDQDRVLLIERWVYPFNYNHYRVIDDRKSGGLIFLKNLSNTMDADDAPFFTVSDVYSIPDLILPKTFSVTYQKSSYTLKAEAVSPVVLFSKFIGDPSNKVTLAPFTSESYGAMYEYSTSGIFALKMPDHTTKFYTPDYPFTLEEIKEETGSVSEVASLALTWNDGTTASETYSPLTALACPAKRYRIKSDLETSRLAESGTISSGVSFYELVSKTDTLYKDVYDLWAPSGSKISMSAFASDHPLIYLKDPFGRWMELVKTKYFIELGADCGYRDSVL
jgi:hypothetical protein